MTCGIPAFNVCAQQLLTLPFALLEVIRQLSGVVHVYQPTAQFSKYRPIYNLSLILEKHLDFQFGQITDNCC